jgi:hypothetical protein
MSEKKHEDERTDDTISTLRINKNRTVADGVSYADVVAVT